MSPPQSVAAHSTNTVHSNTAHSAHGRYTQQRLGSRWYRSVPVVLPGLCGPHARAIAHARRRATVHTLGPRLGPVARHVYSVIA